MMKRYLVVFIFPILLSMSFSAEAQDTSSLNDQRPILVGDPNQSWTWQITEAVLRSSPIPPDHLASSPRDARIAFTTLAQVTLDAAQRKGGFGGGNPPSDIRLFDGRNGRNTLMAGQPNDAHFDEDGVENNAIVRSDPAWLPDASMLAWTERRLPDENQGASLLLYDFTTQQGQTLGRSLPSGEFTGDPPYVVTTDDTIIAESFLAGHDDQEARRVNYPFGIDGTAYPPFTLPPLPEGSPYVMFSAEFNGKVQLGAYYGDNQYGVFNPQTGEGVRFTGTLELLPEENDTPAASFHFNADGTAAVEARGAEFTIKAKYPDSLMSYSWLVPSPDGSLLARLDSDAETITVSQAGTQVAQYRAGKDAHLRSIWWGGERWRLQAEGETTPFSLLPVNDCTVSNTPKLKVGGQGRVLGSPNNLREEPSRSGKIVGQIPEGEIFDVMAGPECSDGIVWWQVEYRGIQAWTAASSEALNFVEPVSADSS